MEKVSIQFTRGYGLWNEREVAGFNSAEASRLVRMSVASYYEKPKAEEEKEQESVTESSGNVFEDLESPEPEEMKKVAEASIAPLTESELEELEAYVKTREEPKSEPEPEPEQEAKAKAAPKTRKKRRRKAKAKAKTGPDVNKAMTSGNQKDSD